MCVSLLFCDFLVYVSVCKRCVGGEKSLISFSLHLKTLNRRAVSLPFSSSILLISGVWNYSVRRSRAEDAEGGKGEGEATASEGGLMNMLAALASDQFALDGALRQSSCEWRCQRLCMIVCFRACVCVFVYVYGRRGVCMAGFGGSLLDVGVM